jgi:hypothetical protein
MVHLSPILEINQKIMFGTFSNEELNAIGDAIKFARGQLASRAKCTLTIGTNVKFTNTRSGGVTTGIVSKVNRKFIIVRSGMTNWRVPANMLSAA